MTKLLHIPSGNFIYFLKKDYTTLTCIFEESTAPFDGLELWIRVNVTSPFVGCVIQGENKFLIDYKTILREEIEIIYD